MKKIQETNKLQNVRKKFFLVLLIIITIMAVVYFVIEILKRKGNDVEVQETQDGTTENVEEAAPPLEDGNPGYGIDPNQR